MFNDQFPFKFYVVHNCWYIFFPGKVYIEGKKIKKYR